MPRQSELFTEADAQPPVLSVAELTAQIKDLLELSFPLVWVVGEVSNFARPTSGHCYLTLKDEHAQVRAVLWRTTASRLRFDLHDGLEVICRGHLDVYGPRGTYQLVIDELQPKGIGALELAYRQLRDRLAAEGLFDPALKRPLPRFARRIGVVTSPTGAAIHDFLQVLSRRWRGADVLIAPTRVQGAGAGEEVAAALRRLNGLAVPIDCIVLTRGGGSLEDLWAFNEEVVVRAIRASRIPVCVGVGHEIDVTLADLAADVRALTPSEAAELVAPAAEDMAARLLQLQSRMLVSVCRQAAAGRRRLENVVRHRAFRRPMDLIHERARQLDECQVRLGRAAAQQALLARRRLESLAARLDGLSPLAVLARGYSITRRWPDGLPVLDAAQLRIGDQLDTHFARGHVQSRVEHIDE